MALHTIFVTRKNGFTVYTTGRSSLTPTPAAEYFNHSCYWTSVLVEDEQVLPDLITQLQGPAASRVRALHILAAGYTTPMITTPSRLIEMAPSWGIAKKLEPRDEELSNPYWVLPTLPKFFKPRQPYRALDELMGERFSQARMRLDSRETSEFELFARIRNLAALNQSRHLLNSRGFSRSQSKETVFQVSNGSHASNSDIAHSTYAVHFTAEDLQAAGLGTRSKIVVSARKSVLVGKYDVWNTKTSRLRGRIIDMEGETLPVLPARRRNKRALRRNMPLDLLAASA